MVAPKEPGRYQNFIQDPPGSPEALSRGCTCPAAENNFGRGRSKNGVIQPEFAASLDCSVHGLESLLKMADEFGEADHIAEQIRKVSDEWESKDRGET